MTLIIRHPVKSLHYAHTHLPTYKRIYRRRGGGGGSVVEFRHIYIYIIYSIVYNIYIYIVRHRRNTRTEIWYKPRGARVSVVYGSKNGLRFAVCHVVIIDKNDRYILLHCDRLITTDDAGLCSTPKGGARSGCASISLSLSLALSPASIWPEDNKLCLCNTRRVRDRKVITRRIDRRVQRVNLKSLYISHNPLF
jgi:hypothetical protein